MRYDTRYRSSGLSSSGYFPPGVKWLLISNAVVFLLYYLSAGTSIGAHFLILSLVPEAVLKHFAIWQLVTYMFLHGGIEHILFNMLPLWMCGSMLESDWGTRRFLKYYFLCGVGAGICDVTLNAMLGHWGTRTIGASGAVYGLLLAFGVLYPNQTVLFNFLFPIKAKYLVMIYGAVAFLGALRINTGVSHIAHLGGMAFGFAYLRLRFAAFDFAQIRRQYQVWKLQRAKKRFQVYLRKHGSDGDPWTH
ncbi:MAG: rhomboid family intramembrane serine protease [Bryobacteraceae bacterium]